MGSRHALGKGKITKGEFKKETKIAYIDGIWEERESKQGLSLGKNKYE